MINIHTKQTLGACTRGIAQSSKAMINLYLNFLLDDGLKTSIASTRVTLRIKLSNIMKLPYLIGSRDRNDFV